MSTRFHVGAKALSSTIGAYAKRFDVLEVRLDARGPSEAALRRQRRSVPPHFEFVVVAPAALAALRASPELDAAVEQTRVAITALQARTLLLSTPRDVTPAAAWRERMKLVLEKLPRDATQIVWEPHGLWEVEDATRAAKRWDVILAVDPARDPVPAGPIAYARLPALGAARSYGEAALERIVDAIGERREAYVIIETSSALTECKTLRRLAQGQGKRKGGGGLVLRPKTPLLRVRDDEQE
jgi:uncharacterized protein YecE (DUF72 family)